MAGHSKWANIQHRKNRQDERRGKLFTRLIREVSVAARTGGKDVSANPRLRLALDKASEANIPKDTLQRAIQKGVGELPGAHYEPVQYEGYGPKGTAIIVECLTDNKIRTVAEVRHAFSKHAGKLGTDGCVAYLFQQVGLFLFEPGASADALMAAAIDAGADNVEQDEEGGLEVSCSPGIFHEVQLRLEHAGFKAYIAEMAMRPDVFVQLSGAEAQSVQKLIDALENLDDVQQVHTNVTPSEFD